MADFLAHSDVLELIAHRAERSVSVFLPTHRTAPGSEQDPIRLRNLLDIAERQLVAAGARTPEARELLQGGRELLDGTPFWSHRSDGLALFLAPGMMRVFRLPMTMPELVVVAERFHVKPLLGLLAADRHFFVLALSQNEVRLLEGNRQRVEEVELTEVPQSLRETLRYDELERQHLAHLAGRGQGGRLIFHGHGVGAEVDKVLLERHLRKLDEGLWQAVLREERAPLVLAGVEYVRSMFRGLTRYQHVLEAGIDGNPEKLSASELHARAWEIVAPVIESMRGNAADRFSLGHGQGHGVVELEPAVRAALEGRVESLFVRVGEQHWGAVDAAKLAIETHAEQQPGDQDLLDLAAVETLLGSGEVFVVQAGEAIPGPGPVAALLRY